MVTSPETIINQIGSKVQAASHKEVLERISYWEAEEVRNDMILSDFARWALTTKDDLANVFTERPWLQVLAAWMDGRKIEEVQRRNIVFYLLSQRVTTDNEWNQLIVDFKDIIRDHEKYLIQRDE